MSDAPKLDAEALRHVDARLTLSAALVEDPKHVTIDTAIRAMQFRARIRETLKELEVTKCK